MGGTGEFAVVHADTALIALDKPAGLLAVPGRGADKQDCLASRVRRRFTDALVVHRLDMATSGLMLMARGADMQRALSRAFATRAVLKRYVAVVHGLLQTPPGAGEASDAGGDAPGGWSLIDLPIAADWPRRPLRVIDTERGRPSQTRWRVLSHDETAGTTRLELEPLTGRTHQLRVHLSAMGHPIVGDALYGPLAGSGVDTANAIEAAFPASPRLLLHACGLALAHPGTAKPLRLQSEPPF